jgi:hypothetical protein
MAKNKKTQDEDIESLSPQQLRLIKQRVADLDNPVRYAVFRCIGGRYCLWLDVESDCSATDIEGATLFKREHAAVAVAKACSKGSRLPLLSVAKITIKNNKRRVVKYNWK